MSIAVTVTLQARSTSPAQPGMLRQPSGPTCDPLTLTISGLRSFRDVSFVPSSSSSGTWTVMSRMLLPTCGAARPTPGAWSIVSNMSSASLRMPSSALRTFTAFFRSTGSGSFTIFRIATSRISTLRSKGSCAPGPATVTVGDQAPRNRPGHTGRVYRDFSSPDSLKHTLRINIHDPAGTGWHSVQHPVHLFGPHHDLPLVLVPDLRDECGRRPEHLHLDVVRPRKARQLASHHLRLDRRGGFLVAADHEPCEPVERREAELLTEPDLVAVELIVVMLRRRDDRVVVWRVCLEDHDAPRPSPTSPACDLGQQLERPLRAPEVRQVEHRVGLDDANRGHAGKVESLRDHLGADDDIDVAVLDALEHLRVPAGAAHGVL